MGLLRRGNRGGREGLTLLETMLALMMMSLLIVGVLGLLGSLLVASTKSSDMTAGTFVGQYLFEKAKVEGPPAPEGGITEGAEQILSHEEEHPVSFNYRMIWTLVAERESYEVHSVSTKNQYGSDLYHVEVQVWWMVKDAESGRAEGGGRRAVTLERLISFAPEGAK
ncbi:MAG: hypothetical protein WC314_07340 [Vulcanimicrobiota bacterium]